MTTLELIIIPCLAVSIAAVGLWVVTMLRVRRCVDASISMREGVDLPEPPGGWPSVSVVIPAHDEEDVIERCARGLLAQDYPNLLITAGLNDPRVHYWEPAKWAARMRDRATGDSMLLLKTNMGAGHGGSSGRYDYLREIAFEYAFMLDHLEATEAIDGDR